MSIKDLLKKQRQAKENGDIPKLRLINNKIYLLRDRARKEKEKAREIELQNKQAYYIDSMLAR